MITNLADLVPHLVVRHNAQTGQTLIISRELKLTGKVLIEEVVLKAVKPEQLGSVRHGSPRKTSGSSAHKRRRTVLEVPLVQTHVLKA